MPEPTFSIWHGGPHQSERARGVIERAGTTLRYLPAYSPDFSSA